MRVYAIAISNTPYIFLLSCPLPSCIVPSAPPHLYSAVADSSSVLSLHWSPPPSIHINGILQYYLVNVTETNTLKKWSIIALNNDLRLGSLHPDYVYVFAITARTIGIGPYSSPVSVRTEEDGNNYRTQHII